MGTDTERVSGVRSPQVRRRAVMTMSSSLLVATVIVVAYFVLPLTSKLAVDTTVELLAGLVVIAGLLTWEVRAIIRSPFPGIQALATLAITVPMFLILFATSYYLMGDLDPGSFSEPMTRLDALYYTVTMFATVGFGDITAVSEAARAVATVQMVLGLILVGLIARVILGAVQVALNRQGGDRSK
jgi:hypothetical protein